MDPLDATTSSSARGRRGLVPVLSPEAVRAGVLVVNLQAGSGRGLSIGARLHVAAHRQDEPLRRRGDLRDRGIERLGVASRRLAEAAHLADVLSGGGLDLAGRGRVVLVAEGADASTHVPRLPQRGRTPGARTRQL
jgi:hypothetical protein